MPKDASLSDSEHDSFQTGYNVYSNYTKLMVKILNLIKKKTYLKNIYIVTFQFYNLYYFIKFV